MNRYKITYSLKDETGYHDASIVERDGHSAKKALKAMLKEEGKKLDSIAEVTIQVPNLPATKQQEREALAEIKAIVESLGEDSYLKTAFEGCFEDAENNIDDDAAYSMKDRWESAEQKLQAAEEKIKALQDNLKARDLEIGKLENKLEDMAHELKERDNGIQTLNNRLAGKIEALEAAENEIGEMAEVIHKQTASIAELSARALSADDLEDLKRLALEEAAIAETHAEEAASTIVEKADDPTSPEFQQAVKDHRSYTSRADYYNALAKRVIEAQQAGA